MAEKNEKRSTRKLFRMTFRGREPLGTSGQWQAKVVSDGPVAALDRALEALELQEAEIEGVHITLIAERTELPEGRVFDIARRSVAFGERGAWTLQEPVPERSPDEGPRKTPLL